MKTRARTRWNNFSRLHSLVDAGQTHTDSVGVRSKSELVGETGALVRR
jgi:hypothetical protein